MILVLFLRKEERGFFSSNRTDSKGGDDIFQFNLPSLKLSLSGVATDLKSGSIITSATISLMGTDGTTASTITDNSGYEFGKDIIKEGVAYELTISKDGYLSNNCNRNNLWC